MKLFLIELKYFNDCTPNVLYLPKEYKNFIQEIDDANNY